MAERRALSRSSFEEDTDTKIRKSPKNVVQSRSHASQAGLLAVAEMGGGMGDEVINPELSARTSSLLERLNRFLVESIIRRSKIDQIGIVGRRHLNAGVQHGAAKGV